MPSLSPAGKCIAHSRVQGYSIYIPSWRIFLFSSASGLGQATVRELIARGAKVAVSIAHGYRVFKTSNSYLRNCYE